MEARLINTTHPTATVPTVWPRLNTGSGRRIADYLQAAGLSERDQCEDIAAKILAGLARHEVDPLDWRAVIAAAETPLARLRPCPLPPTSCRAMPPQDLKRASLTAFSRKCIDGLRQLRMPKVAQGISACLFWMIVFFIP